MPRDTSPSFEKAPATLRQVAQLAGVSATTVSRAMGNRLRISTETRDRILQIADEIGYKPDPELMKLMHHLRGRRKPVFQSVMCGITTRSPATDEPYSDAVIAGVRRQAEVRGYGFTLLRIAMDSTEWPSIQRMLQSRGVQGVLLLPQCAPVDLSRLLPWKDFSVVAATSGLIGPSVHRATPHHFDNMLLLCRNLAALGYRRVGLVIGRSHDLRVNHRFSAAATWHGLNEAGTAVPPLVLEGEPGRDLCDWFKRYTPDALVATEQRLLEAYRRVLSPFSSTSLGLACTSVSPRPIDGSTVCGIDELPEEIGAAAVDLLASMIERHVTGLPESPRSLLLAGRWRPATARSTSRSNTPSPLRSRTRKRV